MIGNISSAAAFPPLSEPKSAANLTRALLGGASEQATDQAAKLAKVSVALALGGEGDQRVPAPSAILDAYA